MQSVKMAPSRRLCLVSPLRCPGMVEVLYHTLVIGYIGNGSLPYLGDIMLSLSIGCVRVAIPGLAAQWRCQAGLYAIFLEAFVCIPAAIGGRRKVRGFRTKPRVHFCLASISPRHARSN